MELVYLWVEEYKNIKNQGFNFSPRFRCNYDPETNELTIDENDDYIENFFGENINVTAIVGKNGSGKSNLLELIKIGIYDEKNGRYFAILFDYQKKDFLQAGNITIDTISTETYANLYNIFYSVQSSYYPDITSSYQISQHLLNVSDDYLYAKSIEEITKQYKINFSLNFFTIKNYTQSKILQAGIHAFFKDNIKLPQDWQLPKYSFIEINTKYVLQSFSSLIEKLKKDNSDSNIINTLEKIKEILVLSEKPIPNQYQILQTICVINFILHSYQGIINIFEQKFNDLFLTIGSLDSDRLILGIKSYFDKDFMVDDAEFPHAKEYFQKCQLLIKILSTYITDDMPCICKLELTRNTKDILDLIELHSSLTITVPNFLSTYFYPHFSTGQEELFNLLAKIYWSIENPIETRRPKDKSTILVLLDEVENYLHPNWQKQLINILINFFQTHYTQYNFHLILTTHSPFLLSDIPKQNIIFLDTYENGNCKVVDGLKEKKETFGANIHTLLSDSFFMEDGLMGEFAKEKINEIIEFHKVVEKRRHKTCLAKIYETKRKHFWDIQSIIGENYLKQVIKNHLVEIEKILLGKDAAKQEEIKRTEKYLESLKNDKS